MGAESTLPPDMLDKINRISTLEIFASLWYRLRARRESSSNRALKGTAETTRLSDASIEGQLSRYRLQYQRRIKGTNKHEQLAKIPRRLYWANIVGLYLREKAARKLAKGRRIGLDIYVDFLSEEEEEQSLIQCWR
jgi:hypothetical protein